MGLKSIVLLLILLIPGALIVFAALLLALRNLMVIRVNHKRTVAKAIEWTDSSKKTPIGFILKCPHCRRKQWANKKELYVGFDGTKNNYRCKRCGVGLAKRHHNEYPTPSHGFSPKCPGWRSIHDDS
jgi:hypothetical protein